MELEIIENLYDLIGIVWTYYIFNFSFLLKVSGFCKRYQYIISWIIFSSTPLYQLININKIKLTDNMSVYFAPRIYVIFLDAWITGVLIFFSHTIATTNDLISRHPGPATEYK